LGSRIACGRAGDDLQISVGPLSIKGVDPDQLRAVAVSPLDQRLRQKGPGIGFFVDGYRIFEIENDGIHRKRLGLFKRTGLGPRNVENRTIRAGAEGHRRVPCVETHKMPGAWTIAGPEKQENYAAAQKIEISGPD